MPLVYPSLTYLVNIIDIRLLLQTVNVESAFKVRETLLKLPQSHSGAERLSTACSRANLVVDFEFTNNCGVVRIVNVEIVRVNAWPMKAAKVCT